MVNLSFIGLNEIFKKEYFEITTLLPNKKITFTKFNHRYFKSIRTYNLLLLSRKFYTCFHKYDWLLLFQLDSYIFGTEIDEFYQSKFAYFGAPWLENEMNLKGLYVGNGGLSLRKISVFNSILKRKLIIPDFIWEFYTLPSIYNLMSKFMYFFFFSKSKYLDRNSNFDYAKLFGINEDFVFSKFFMEDEPFHIPTKEFALKFSFETNPRLCYKLNNNALPFGCHAWERYDPEFWSVHIK